MGRVLVHLYLFHQNTRGQLQERVKHLWAICSVYQVPGAQFGIDIPRATKLLCLRVQNKGQSSFSMVLDANCSKIHPKIVCQYLQTIMTIMISRIIIVI